MMGREWRRLDETRAHPVGKLGCPLISVVIATRNRLPHLRACLRAIARQAVVTPVQVCVVNDGGASVAPVVEQVQREHPHIQFWFHDLAEHRGQVHARRLAITAARGEFIAFCDDDDRWLPNHLSSLWSLLQSSDAVWAHTDAELVEVRRRGGRIEVGDRFAFAWKRADLLLRRYNPLLPSTVLYKKAAHLRLGGLDESMGDYWDWDFWLRLNKLSRPLRVPVATVLYGLDADGGQASFSPDSMRPYLTALTDKHGLGELPTMNFRMMLDQPDLAPYRAQTRILWDGDPGLWDTGEAQTGEGCNG